MKLGRNGPKLRPGYVRGLFGDHKRLPKDWRKKRKARRKMAKESRKRNRK